MEIWFYMIIGQIYAAMHMFRQVGVNCPSIVDKCIFLLIKYATLYGIPVLH